MRRRNIALALALVLALSSGQPLKANGLNHSRLWSPIERGLEIQSEGRTLRLTAMDDRAVRVTWGAENANRQEELIWTTPGPAPAFTTHEDKRCVYLCLKAITAVYDKRSGSLSFRNGRGDLILSETKGGRSMRPAMDQGEKTWTVEQRFVSPRDESLFGTGQFQDGILDVRGLIRRLTQVNTQISVPFVLSNKGYGLLWHNYGLTDFNPADSCVQLSRGNSATGEAQQVHVTSTQGDKTEMRQFGVFTGELIVPQTGKYSLMLDVGQSMARKYHLRIDGRDLVRFDNFWLPPTTSLFVTLTKGRHHVEVEGEKEDHPSLYYRFVNNETVLRSPVASQLDYTVISGHGDEVTACFHRLSGGVPMLPQWAFGYVHCRERFHSQQELLDNASEFRNRHLPADVMVQDWQYWGKYGWNAMKFDETNYPDPAAMMRELHDMHLHLMLSVWSMMDRNCELGKQMVEKGYYIGQTQWIDFLNPKAAAFYWNAYAQRLLPYNIDCWWQDATEPENDGLRDQRVCGGTASGNAYRNVYTMYVNRTVYEGLRKDCPGQRAMILTRSGFAGLQKYGCINWSGDVGNNWETLRRQIAGGLSLMASGQPWWTYDAGGFFRPDNQYADSAYHERLLRWFEAATFLPMQRVHGYISNTEPWRYGPEVERVMRLYMGYRYRMLPYVYSCAAAVTLKGSMLMRPLVMDFPGDSSALRQRGSYMFGPSLLVAPVMDGGVRSWSVYLPQCRAGWMDFWTGRVMTGGQTVEVPVSLDKVPLFARRGSILLLGADQEYVGQHSDAPCEIRVYPGADASFTLYEDDGNSYNYEKGQYALCRIGWNDRTGVLTLSRRQGTFPGMAAKRTFRVVRVNPDNGTGFREAETAVTVVYEGKEIKVPLRNDR